MAIKRIKLLSGFTLFELIIASVASIIVIMAVAVLLTDSQRGWNRLYNSINSGVVVDSYIAKNKFDSVVRKSSGQSCLLDADGNWLEVYYYNSASSSALDRYARFYSDSSDLFVEYGSLNPKQTLNFETICHNVAECNFKKIGRSAQMLLTLDDGSQSITTVSSAVMHN